MQRDHFIVCTPAPLHSVALLQDPGLSYKLLLVNNKPIFSMGELCLAKCWVECAAAEAAGGSYKLEVRRCPSVSGWQHQLQCRHQ